MELLKVDINPNDFVKHIFKLGFDSQIGIYKLFYFENGRPRPINRFLGKDKEGLLYIGMTEAPFLSRVSKLQKALYSNSYRSDSPHPINSGHTQMSKKYFRIRNKVKVEDLYIRMEPDGLPKEAESKALEAYVKKYGELPPLNGQYGYFDPDWKIF